MFAGRLPPGRAGGVWAERGRLPQGLGSWPGGAAPPRAGPLLCTTQSFPGCRSLGHTTLDVCFLRLAVCGAAYCSMSHSPVFCTRFARSKTFCLTGSDKLSTEEEPTELSCCAPPTSLVPPDFNESLIMGSLLATYGWYIIFSCILLLVVIQKLSARFRALRQRQLDQETTVVEPDIIVKRQEALAAARLKMQEELNAQAEKHKEKLRQLEEEKRRLKIVKWDSMQEGKSYKGSVRRPQEEDHSVPSTSSVPPKHKPERKPLRRGGYNPLSGEGGGTCSWRPGRRGPSSGG
ncbi:selenoprotein S [Echinops telfairi]|uniref:Selenoprotein S n=1 Tax=Echinops telfairi TaxID=9371 RepID=A0ABM0ZTZ0_ECHTE|nr:selenoprotein S [Echinops telfairi]